MQLFLVEIDVLTNLQAWSAPTSNKDNPINEIAGVIVRGPINRMRNPIVPVAPITT